jgi:hypothetical protein
VQTPQRGRRLDADLLDQPAASVAVDLERLRLPPTAIQREHQLAREPLTDRMLAEQSLQLADQRRVPAGGEIGLHARLQRGQPLLLQPRDLRLRERLELQARQRRPAPQPQRLPQQPRRLHGSSGCQRPPALLHAALEALGIQLARTHLQPVAGRGGRDHLAIAERLTQPRHVDLHRPRRVRRRRLPPQPQRQPLGADRLIGVQQQHRQHRARLDRAQRHRAGLAMHLKRSEDPELHHPSRRTLPP